MAEAVAARSGHEFGGSSLAVGGPQAAVGVYGGPQPPAASCARCLPATRTASNSGQLRLSCHHHGAFSTVFPPYRSLLVPFGIATIDAAICARYVAAWPQPLRDPFFVAPPSFAGELRLHCVRHDPLLAAKTTQ